jgi:hypothetical protein
MFEILPAAALLLLVQPAVQQPPSVSGIEKVTIAVVEQALESSLNGRQNAKDDPVTNGAAVGAVIGAAAAVTVMVIAAKDGGWGPDQDGLALMIGAAAGAGALVGAGVDAMLERSPSAGLSQCGARRESRMRPRLPKGW